MTRVVAGADEPDEVDAEAGLVALQRYVDAHAPFTPPDVGPDGGLDGGDVEPAGDDPARAVARSRRVRRLRDEVTQAHALLRLQADDAPLRVDSAKVRRRRRAALDAARLHELARDPAAQAWRAVRWRRAVTAAAMSALVLALGWSTAGVQHFAAGGAVAGSAAWWLAWLVEPLISLALLSVVGAKAYFASRGQPLHNWTLGWIEGGFLATTVMMNVWPYLPWVAAQFEFAALFIHTIGPVVAVSVVTALPILWQHFVDLDHGPTASPYPSPTPPTYRANIAPHGGNARPGPGSPVGATGPVVDPLLLDRAVALVRGGALPPQPSATQLRNALGCGTDSARLVRDELRRRPGLRQRRPPTTEGDQGP